MRICLDATRAGDGLGWEPRVTLDEGVRLAAEFYREKVASGEYSL